MGSQDNSLSALPTSTGPRSTEGRKDGAARPFVPFARALRWSPSCSGRVAIDGSGSSRRRLFVFLPWSMITSALPPPDPSPFPPHSLSPSPSLRVLSLTTSTSAMSSTSSSRDTCSRQAILYERPLSTPPVSPRCILSPMSPVPLWPPSPRAPPPASVGFELRITASTARATSGAYARLRRLAPVRDRAGSTTTGPSSSAH
mmetsp:Transcript_17352/g.42879  ORF Transcript_17352/g.42879 Transcript_17352/m.42879 type:complete len:201 (-) Transcript_17352:730-1332(-)